MLHFLVDSLCVCCLFLLADTSTATSLMGVFLTYNILAFLTQPLTGMAADRVRQRRLLLQASVALLAAGVAVASLTAGVGRGGMVAFMAVALLLGMGNSLFHVWGGKEVAIASGNDIRALGVFVATGALGLAVGAVWHAWWLLYALLAVLVALSVVAHGAYSATATAVSTVTAAANANSAPGGASKPDRSIQNLLSFRAWVVVLLLMAIVMFRSYAGERFTAGVAKGADMMLLIGALAMTGKALGGFIVRERLAFLLVLTTVVILLELKADSIWWLGLLLVNGTMAFTLWLANKFMPGREGLVFGLLAAALMPGYMLAMAGADRDAAILRLLLTLLPTIAIELGVLWALRERHADVLWSAVVVNILTNIPLNLFLTYVDGGWTALIAGEAIVLVVEALWYSYFVRSWGQAFAYSGLCNGFSFFIGMLVQLVWILFNS